jgi:glycosyltransferase involved in cell wall biosynthesis
MTMRVTQVGNSPHDRGGISSVIRTYADHPDPDVVVGSLVTYDSRSRVRTLTRFLTALVRIAITRRGRLGVVHVHLSMRGSFVREGVLLVVASARRLPVVATVHGSSFVAWSATRPRLTRAVLGRARRVTVLSDVVARHLAGLGVDNVVVVPNGVVLRPHVPIPAGEPVVIFAGEVSRRKGADVLLDAWPEVVRVVPTARVRLVGELVDVTPHRRVRGVELLGEQSHEEVLSQLTKAWAAVLPSRFEGLPMFLLEAMAAGRGIVATPVGGIPDLVPERAAELGAGATGELVAVGDQAGLADALVRALDRAVATARGAAARDLVEQRFSVELVRAQMRRVWDDALAPRR